MLRVDHTEISAESSEGRDNTPLHHAIINNNKTLAFEYIEKDKTLPPKEQMINKKSLGNTPLLLALKTGNMEIAEKLLTHPNIRSFIHDQHGLTPLHWACMLRQDKIISLLLKDEDSLCLANIKKWWDPKNKSIFVERSTPFHLYWDEVSVKAMESYGKFGDFEDSDKLAITKAEAYTDTIFHMRSLCQNLQWNKVEEKELKFVHLNDEVNSVPILQSKAMFKINFVNGAPVFCRQRNAVPVNRELAKQLAEALEELDKYDALRLLAKSPSSSMIIAKALAFPMNSVSCDNKEQVATTNSPSTNEMSNIRLSA